MANVIEPMAQFRQTVYENCSFNKEPNKPFCYRGTHLHHFLKIDLYINKTPDSNQTVPEKVQEFYEKFTKAYPKIHAEPYALNHYVTLYLHGDIERDAVFRAKVASIAQEVGFSSPDYIYGGNKIFICTSIPKRTIDDLILQTKTSIDSPTLKEKLLECISKEPEN